MIEERRRHLRAKEHLPLKIANKTFDVITETVDISPSGIYCRVTRFLPLMSKIDVILLLPAKGNGKETVKIRCRGVVVRTEPIILKDTEKGHYNVAIFFTEVSKKNQKILESYVDVGDADEKEIEINN